MKNTGELCCAI